MSMDSPKYTSKEIGKMIENRVKGLIDKGNYTQADIPGIIDELLNLYFSIPREKSREYIAPAMESYVRMHLRMPAKKHTEKEISELVEDGIRTLFEEQEMTGRLYWNGSVEELRADRLKTARIFDGILGKDDEAEEKWKKEVAEIDARYELFKMSEFRL